MTEVDNIIFQDPKKTFMEILKVHNKEVPFANLLAFFFRPKETHNLGTLFIDSLFDTKHSNIFENKVEELTLEKLEYDKTSVEVLVEEPTKKGRIDLLIVTNTFVICIEFKINHFLNNPLEDYKKFIEEHPEYSKKEKYYFVLTPFEKAPIEEALKYFEDNNEFKQVILSHFIKTVKDKNEQIPLEDRLENSIHYHYFNEFIQTVENRKIRSLRRKELTDLSNQLNNKELGSKYHSNNQGGFVEVLRGTNAVKIRIKPTGWQVEQWKDGLMTLKEVNVQREDLAVKTIELKSSFLS
jgi:hypothetical protein